MKTAHMVAMGMALAVAQQAWAQSNVGELLDKGGKQLSKEQILEKMKNGSRFSGSSQSGASLNLELKADKSLSGNVSSPRGTSGVFGTWDVEDSGRVCVNYVVQAINSRDQTCSFQYLLGSVRYSAKGTDRSESVSSSVLD